MSKLMQCPYSAAVKCEMDEACKGCEVYSKHLVGETTPPIDAPIACPFCGEGGVVIDAKPMHTLEGECDDVLVGCVNALGCRVMPQVAAPTTREAVRVWNTRKG